jgi:putative ABC transport system permease protein
MIELGIWQIVIALGLMLVAIALAYQQRLELVWSLLVATVRTVFQLFAVGYILAIVFAWRNPWSVLAVLMVMAAIAIVVARNRIGKNLRGLLPIIAGSLLTSTAVTMLYTTGLVLRPDVWYDPRYLIPLTGIVLGNAMNAAAITGDRLVTNLKRHAIEIETHLSLGATPAQAIATYRKEAIQAGLIPTLNAMMVVGIVTLPGIITGQLLSGADPLNAAYYQMLIMFMLAFSNLLTSVLISIGLRRRCFNAADQLVPL